MANGFTRYPDLEDDMNFVEVYNVTCNKTNNTGTPYSVWVDVLSSNDKNNNATSVHVLGDNETVTYD